MTYKKTDFVPFSADAQRSIANLEAAYEQLVDVEREQGAIPASAITGDRTTVRQILG